jgi:hypothetical protein
MIILLFETPSLPPPHAFALTCKVSDALHFEAVFTPLNGDELPEEEWIESGMQPEKEWKASGELPSVWREVLSNWCTIALSEAPTFSSHSLTITTKEGSRSGFVTDEEGTYYAMQELLQAIKEAAGMEDVLELFVQSGKKVQLIQASFAHRTVHWFTSPQSFVVLDWDSLQAIIQLASHADPDLKKATTSISWDGNLFFGLPEDKAEALLAQLETKRIPS